MDTTDETWHTGFPVLRAQKALKKILTEHSGSPPCEVASLVSQCTDEETGSRKSGDLPSASAVGTPVALALFCDPNALMPGRFLPMLGSSAACTPISPLLVSHSFLPSFWSQPEEKRHLHTLPSRILTTGITRMKTKRLIYLVLFPVSPTRTQAPPGKGLYPACSFPSPSALAEWVLREYVLNGLPLPKSPAPLRRAGELNSSPPPLGPRN